MKVSRGTDKSILFTPIIMETEVLQAGDIGAVGVSKFRWCTEALGAATQPDVKNFVDALHQLYVSLSAHVPPNISHAIQVDTKILDVPSGQLLGMVEYPGSPTTIQGSASGTQYVAGTGMRLEWLTEGVNAGRVVRGATFLVPMSSDVWTNNGALQGPTQNGLITNCVTFLTTTSGLGVHHGVYHRPAKGLSSGGIWFEATAVRVGTTPAGLRSRRKLQ